MAKEKQSPVPEATQPPLESNTSIETVKGEVPDLFNRPAPSLRPIKSIKIGRTLTRELIAMAHREQLIFTCTGEMEPIHLPGTGRKAEALPARAVAGVDEFDFENGVPQSKYVTLIFNEMMVSALEREGYRVCKFVENGDGQFKTVYVGDKSLIGQSFGFRSQGIKADKSYRVIDVVPVEIER